MPLTRRLSKLRNETATPTPVRTLAMMWLAGGISGLAASFFPADPHAPVELLRALGVIALFGTAGLWLAGERVRPWLLNVFVAMITVATSLVVWKSVTGVGMIVSACTYLWVGVYVGFFFSRTAARAQMGLITVCFGAAVLLSEVWVPVAAWAFITASLLIAGETVGNLSSQLRHEAHTDSLTGALNRSGLAIAAERAFSLADRTGIPLTIALIDLDDFKEINDRDGHLAGDRLLERVTEIWKAELEPSDVFARLGGDEFLAVLVGGSREESTRLFTRMGVLTPVSWSAGVITRWDGEELGECLSRADRALYESKRARSVSRLAVDREQDDRARHPDHRSADHPVVAG